MDFSFESVSKTLGTIPSKFISTKEQAKDVHRHQYNTRSSISSAFGRNVPDVRQEPIIK